MKLNHPCHKYLSGRYFSMQVQANMKTRSEHASIIFVWENSETRAVLLHITFHQVAQ